MIAAWLRERFPLRFFGAVAAVIALGAGGGHFTPASLSWMFAATVLLLAQFRVWDDLADRRADRVRHPERIVARAASVVPLVWFCVALGCANFIAASHSSVPRLSLTVLALLHVVLAAWYLRRPRRTAAGDHLLLAKYPAFVCVVSGGRLLEAPALVLAAAAVIYVAACAYEALHDPFSPLAHYGGRS